jgi:ribosomal protein S18 acetylase RimI-like enzyme
MNIRLATKNDLYRIAEMTKDLTVHLGAFEWTVENHLKHITRRFNNAQYIHIVAESNKEIIGFTGAEQKNKRTAYMLKGYVEPKQRKKGVMRMMEAKLIEILKEKGIARLDLKVDPNNKEGINTWTALGYETISETRRKMI